MNLVVVLFQVLLSPDYIRKTHSYLNFLKYLSRFKKVDKQINAPPGFFQEHQTKALYVSGKSDKKLRKEKNKHLSTYLFNDMDRDNVHVFGAINPFLYFRKRSFGQLANQIHNYEFVKKNDRIFLSY